MIAIRTENEIDILRQANQMVAKVHVALGREVAPGVTTGELDDYAHELILGMGGEPAFLGYQGFPKSTCISVDEVIVHGVPGRRKLREGELVSIDVGVRYEGYVGDAALTLPCGEVDETRRRLMEVTDRALSEAIKAAKAGNHVGDIGAAVDKVCKGTGFSIIRCFTGHGIGEQMHEPPQIVNFKSRQRGAKLKPGMIMAIEPMLSAGVYNVQILSDGWSAVSGDGKPSAHFEHSIAVRDGQAEVLSATPELVWGQSL